MSTDRLRMTAIGALSGLAAGALIAIPVTAVAHAIVLDSYQPTPLELAKSTCCGQVLPGFWSQVLPDLDPGDPLFVRTLLGLAGGAAFGVMYVVFRNLAPGPTLLKASLFGVALALPFDVFVPGNVGTPGVFALPLTSPWEAAFSFPGPLGTVPPYHLPIEFRLLLAIPILAAGLGMAALVQVLERWLPEPGVSRVLALLYVLPAAVAGVGLLFLPLITGLIQIGGD